MMTKEKIEERRKTDPLQAWISEQTVGDEMLWKGPWGRQVEFIRDDLRTLIGVGLDYEDKNLLGRVISTHTSKSIVLPVVEFERKDLGLRLIFRNNFHNWKMSVISQKTAIVANFDGLFHTTPPIEPDYTGDPLASVYFEGFPRDLIFGYYARSNTRWLAEIDGNHTLWTTVFLIMRALGAVKLCGWHTRESHRAELDAETEKQKAREAAKLSISEGKP
jgi:hypothetical protein